MSKQPVTGPAVLHPQTKVRQIHPQEFRSSKDEFMKCENCGEQWAKHIDYRWCALNSRKEQT